MTFIERCSLSAEDKRKWQKIVLRCKVAKRKLDRAQQANDEIQKFEDGECDKEWISLKIVPWRFSFVISAPCPNKKYCVKNGIGAEICPLQEVKEQRRTDLKEATTLFNTLQQEKQNFGKNIQR